MKPIGYGVGVRKASIIEVFIFVNVKEKQMMSEITFEQIPLILGEIKNRLDRIEGMLTGKEIQEHLEEGFMNITEAASFLNLAESTIYGKVCRSEIPVNKKGKRLYFEKEELQKWVLEGRRKTVEERIGEANSQYLGSRGRRSQY
ncbi:helix-turn-helix domain-containing protein [Taibaiella koreensis]|uniref:helix-turn-helix domain-containing protein n=1 Tax=Taibaiella koreensis TaxID=1268548 RepID=UPI001969756B|nr:helix-turn-helix domain-containing protein [Taibaiella koreensis]